VTELNSTEQSSFSCTVLSVFLNSVCGASHLPLCEPSIPVPKHTENTRLEPKLWTATCGNSRKIPEEDFTTGSSRS